MMQISEVEEVSSEVQGVAVEMEHDRFPPKGSVLEGKSSISGKSRLMKSCNLARKCFVKNEQRLLSRWAGESTAQFFNF